MSSNQARHMIGRWALCLLLVLLFSHAVQAESPESQGEQPVCPNVRREVEDLDTGREGHCQIPGMGDFYGIGVRLGIYLTWITSWVANNFVAGEMAGALDTNSIFLFALLMCVATLTSMRQVLTIDNLVLVQLSNGYIFGVMSLWGCRTRFWKKNKGSDGDSHFGGWGTHFRLLLCFTASCYNLWFWVWDIAHPSPACYMREECGGLKLFLFTSVRANGWMRYSNAIFSATCCLYYGVMIIVASASLVRHLFRRITAGEKIWIPQNVEEDNFRKLNMFYVGIAGFNAQWMIFTAISVELTLHWNHVTGVSDASDLTSAGQLLALLIGVFSTFRIFWIVYSEHKEKRANAASEHGQVEYTRNSARTEMLDEMKSVITTLRSIEKEERGRWVRIALDTWLPWLNCFPSWKNQR